MVINQSPGVFQTGGFPDLDLSFLFCPFLSFLGLSRFFWDFPDLLGDGPEIFPIVLFLFLGLLRAPTRNSPERVRDTIWTFPEKSGNTRVWKPPGLASPNRGPGIEKNRSGPSGLNISSDRSWIKISIDPFSVHQEGPVNRNTRIETFDRD